MKKGRRKKMAMGFVLAVLSVFLLAPTGWAAYVAEPFQSDVITPANPNQLFDPERHNEALSTPDQEALPILVEAEPKITISELTIQDEMGRASQFIRSETYRNDDGTEGSVVLVRNYVYNDEGELVGYEETVTNQGWIPSAGTGELVYHDERASEFVPAGEGPGALEAQALALENDPVRRIESEITYRIAIIANRLVVIGYETLTKIWDFLTGDYTESQSVINTKYNRAGDPVRQTGYSTSETESKDGTVSVSRTKLTFEYNAGAGGFVVTRQVTDTITHSPGALREDRYLTDDNGELILDENGDPILLDTAEADDVVSTTRSIITREYDETGKLIKVEGTTRGKTVGNGEVTRFDGTMEFEVKNNTEVLKSQTTNSTTRNVFTGERTVTTSVYNQETDYFGRILSAQATAHSETRPRAGNKVTISDSVTNFIVTDRGTVAAVSTVTESVSWDYDKLEVTYSTQTVNIDVDQRTGKVLGATGTLESQTVNLVKDEVTGELRKAEGEEITRIANTTGTMTFIVINNQILLTESYTRTEEHNVTENTVSIQEQLVKQNYDPETGLGTTGTIETHALTVAEGSVVLADTSYNFETGEWNIGEGEGDCASYTVSDSKIDTEYLGGQFQAVRIASLSVVYDDVEKTVTVNATFTRQVFSASGQLLGQDIQGTGFGTDLVNYHSQTVDLIDLGLDFSEASVGEIIGALQGIGGEAFSYYFDWATPINDPGSWNWGPPPPPEIPAI